MAEEAPAQVAIRARGLGVSFGGVSVLRNIDLDIGIGKIHGLVGENGAGKSTLGKVLGGYYAASAGRLEVFGQPAAPWNPRTALARGVALMHQELQLVPELTVAQNVFLGIEDRTFGFLHGTEAARLAALMTSSGYTLDPQAVVSSLSIADRQKIEILRALARNARVIVMDEPTSSLAKDEVNQLHQTMRTLRDAGRSVIYVSHFLDDVLSVSDRITVLRDGDHVLTRPADDLTKGDIVSAMLGGGKSQTPFPPKRPSTDTTLALEVVGLTSASGVRDVSLSIRRGEIVGLIGLVGSGRTEIARAIVGADPSTGTVRLNGQDYTQRSPHASTSRGLVMVPEDRRKQGLVMSMAVRPNVTLPHLGRFASRGWMRRARETRAVRQMIDHFQVRPAATEGDVSFFSGGNQQKVLLGKWLAGDPGVVILDEPSRGVDVGARQRIHEAIADLAQNGVAVLVISSEIEEVLGLSHRAYLVDRGRIVEEVDPSRTDEAAVLGALFQHQSAPAPSPLPVAAAIARP
jgi:ribose transport system ATP-binding protein